MNSKAAVRDSSSDPAPTKVRSASTASRGSLVSFFGELRRRNVVKVAAAYVFVGWLLIEVSSVLGPALSLPDSATTLVAFLLILGLPVAMLLSWAYELTPEGMKKTKSVPLTESITNVTGKKLDFVIIGVLAIAVAFFAVERFVLEESSEAEIVADELVEAVPPLVAEEQRTVLPDPDNAYFAAGIHEEVLNQLAKLRNLNVISRTFMVRYADSDLSIPEISDELNVETVMEGSVRYADDRVLVTAQLIDPETDAHLWSDSYNRDFAGALTGNAPAQQEEWEQVAQENAERALELDPTLGLARAAIAFVHQAHWLWAEAEESFNQALQLSPNDPNVPTPYSRFQRFRGEYDEAIRAGQRAADLDPKQFQNHYQLGIIYRYVRNYDAAVDSFRDAIDLLPSNGNGHAQLGYTRKSPVAIGPK